MATESLIALQSSGRRSIGEPPAPRPIAVQQGSVLVVLDVNKAVPPGALYWTLANVVRKGDNLKILGIITHIGNAMGFMMRVEQSTRSSPNIMELQFEIATKKEAIWRTAHVKEWCQKAGVKLEVDVKAGNNPKVIAIDEAKSIGAYHIVLDKNMKKDRKYFVDNLSCFVSRFTSSGGVDSIRSFATNSNKLPPMAPTTPKAGQVPSHQSISSIGSNASYRGASSMSSTSFELGGESGDDFSAHEGHPLSAPSTSDSMDRIPNFQLPAGVHLIIRTMSPDLGVPEQKHHHQQQQQQQQHGPNLYNLLRVPVLDSGDNGIGFNLNNPLRKGPAVRKWFGDDDGRINMADISEQGPLTPRTEFRFEQGPATLRGGPRLHHHNMGSMGSLSWMIGQLNVAPELVGLQNTSRRSLTASLQTQASFNSGCGGKQYTFRADEVTMDMHWPLMHWADCRAMRLRSSHHYSSSSSSSSSSSAMLLSVSNSSMSNFRTAVRRKVPVSSGLNYSDMVDSD